MLLHRAQYLALLFIVLIGSACDDTRIKKVVYVDRTSCLACHRPIDEEGTPHGIEEAHPLVGGEPLTCVECHGGDPKNRTQSGAHVQPPEGHSRFIRNLTSGEIDAVGVDYVRFINPGDLRAAKVSCGSESPRAGGGSCHQGVLDRIPTNPMATFAGELGVGRHRAGIQPSGEASKSIYPVVDPEFKPGKIPATVGHLEPLEEPTITADEDTIGPYQDLYFTKACMRCHLWSFGDNKFTGDFRSSGCSACHMLYNNDGVSTSADPVLGKSSPPHPAKHTLTKAIPTKQCTHCHYRGGRIGPSYQGFREGAGAGYNPDFTQTLGIPLHGHDANYYITDEDTRNSYDETPPDVHFEAGMHCIDCHTEADVHGDGRIYSDSTNAVEITCESCHGDSKALATLRTRSRTPDDPGRRLNNVEIDDDGVYWLTGKVDKTLRLKVPQVKSSVDTATEGSLIHQLMGRDINGFSHMDRLACDTCHSAWTPTCFGCHITVDMGATQRSLIGGQSTPGKVSGARKWVETDVMILMLDTAGKVRLSQPAERMFFNAKNADGEVIINKRVRTGPNGEIGHGQRPFAPHTVRRNSPFMQCARCHPADDEFSNMEQVMQAIGMGSNNFLEEDGEGRVWALDRIFSENDEGERLLEVLIGHDEPQKAAPLPAEMIERMLNIRN